MATVLYTGMPNLAHEYLAQARKHLSQAALAKQLDIDVRTLRRWEVRETDPPKYIALALKQLLLPLTSPAVPPLSREFTFIDLFAGIGGMRKAFEKIGGQCVLTSEWDAYAVKTYTENFRGLHRLEGDITAVDEQTVPDHDVLLAGFPCQPFSIAGVSKKNSLGRLHGFDDETQGTLFFDVERIIAAKRPRAFLLENVKNLKSHDKGRTFEVIHRTLTKKLGYDVHFKVIDGGHFVPQHRERIIIVGFREPVAFDWNMLELPAKTSHTLADILHRTDGTEPHLAWDADRFFDHGKRVVNPKYTLTENLWTYLQNYKAKHEAAGNGFGFGLVTSKQTSRTLSARYYKDGSEILISQGARKRPRRLTPRECARLMGFGDDFQIPVSDTRVYQQFAGAAMPPMIEAVGRLMVSALPPKRDEIDKTPASISHSPREDIMSSGRWTRDQLKLCFFLYCQLPFGKLDQRTKEVIELALKIGRTPSAVAMKLSNFASLDPAITGTGRKGLAKASNLDREIWDEFNADWEKLATECALLRESLDGGSAGETKALDDIEENAAIDYSVADKKAVSLVRVKQNFFRRAVLISYEGRCCMSGVSDARLLVASHIVPWSADVANRLNPRNGLCLSAIHDKAFDRGLIALSDDHRVMISDSVRRSPDAFVQEVLVKLEGREIALPYRFQPMQDFIVRHRKTVFEQVQK
jgi:DNA-cytosine methyltransferase